MYPVINALFTIITKHLITLEILLYLNTNKGSLIPYQHFNIHLQMYLDIIQVICTLTQPDPAVHTCPYVYVYTIA